MSIEIKNINVMNTSKGLLNLYSRFICTSYLQLPRKLTDHINVAGEHVNRLFPASYVLTASPEKRRLGCIRLLSKANDHEKQPCKGCASLRLPLTL